MNGGSGTQERLDESQNVETGKKITHIPGPISFFPFALLTPSFLGFPLATPPRKLGSPAPYFINHQRSLIIINTCSIWPIFKHLALCSTNCPSLQASYAILHLGFPHQASCADDLTCLNQLSLVTLSLLKAPPFCHTATFSLQIGTMLALEYCVQTSTNTRNLQVSVMTI